MKGVITRENNEMVDIFNAINNEQLNYNWLITDYLLLDNLETQLEDYEGYLWLTGEEFTFLNKKFEEGEWVWGVFSGFAKDIKLSDILKYDLPHADGYGGFWKKDITIQHPLAEIEIVAWDGTETLFISKDAQLEEQFKSHFEDAEYLDYHNSHNYLFFTISGIDQLRYEYDTLEIIIEKTKHIIKDVSVLTEIGKQVTWCIFKEKLDTSIDSLDQLNSIKINWFSEPYLIILNDGSLYLNYENKIYKSDRNINYFNLINIVKQASIFKKNLGE